MEALRFLVITDALLGRLVSVDVFDRREARCRMGMAEVNDG
jgi:hypothetical protein